MSQITGDDLDDMSLEILRDTAPDRTRAECKLLLQTVSDIQTASQVCCCVFVCPVAYRAAVTFKPDFASQNPSNARGLLRQLNVWFPGEFRAIADAPLYSRGETTVVQATHKVR